MSPIGIIEMIGNQTGKKIIFDVYLDQVSWKYNLNKHAIHLKPLDLQRNSPYAVIRRF